METDSPSEEIKAQKKGEEKEERDYDAEIAKES